VPESGQRRLPELDRRPRSGGLVTQPPPVSLTSDHELELGMNTLVTLKWHQADSVVGHRATGKAEEPASPTAVYGCKPWGQHLVKSA
jgi:hypothetical protein